MHEHAARGEGEQTPPHRRDRLEEGVQNYEEKSDHSCRHSSTNYASSSEEEGGVEG